MNPDTIPMPRLRTVQWADGESKEAAATARQAITDFGIVRVAGFPTTTSDYRGFLEMFGNPLDYYGSDAGTHPEDGSIWRIKYDPIAAASGETHAIAGPLAPHSSQSLRDPRPKFFSMLMINAGWQSRPFGQNGESILAPWRAAFAYMRLTLGERFEQFHGILLDVVEFPDTHMRAVAYELPTARSVDDLGVRLKSNHLEYLQERSPDDLTTAAIAELAAAAEKTALRTSLRSGDLILMDNDRWGHGRESVIGHERSQEGQLMLNPRELWSVTVG